MGRGGEAFWRKNDSPKTGGKPGTDHIFQRTKWPSGPFPFRSLENVVCPRFSVAYNPRMARRIALVEDDSTIRQNYVDALTRAGYEVAAFGDRAGASRALSTRLPELAIIDIGLGADVDGGFDLCRELRAASARLPIIFLSARDSDFDIVSGLRLGADDYLTKDVSLPHLLARIAALFRRVDATSQPAVADDVLHRGRLALDAQRMMASWNGRPVDLTVTEF